MSVERAKAEDPRELRKRIAELERELKRAQKIEAPPDAAMLDRARADGAQMAGRELSKVIGQVNARDRQMVPALEAALTHVHKALDVARTPIDVEIPERPQRADTPRAISPGRAASCREIWPPVPAEEIPGRDALDGPEQRIIDALAWLETIGVSPAEESAAAFLAGYRVGGGAWCNPRGRLKTRGLIDYVGTAARLALTDAGRALARMPQEPPSTEALQEMVLAKLNGPERRLLEPLLAAYPEALSNEELAEAAGYAQGGGAYTFRRGANRIRALELFLAGQDTGAEGEAIAGPLVLRPGLVGTPAIILGDGSSTFDTTTGWWRPTANVWGFSVSGAEVLRFLSTGIQFASGGTAAVPRLRLSSGGGVFFPTATAVALAANGAVSRVLVARDRRRNAAPVRPASGGLAMNGTTDSSPPTRDPASHGQLLLEGAAILTPIATIIAWALTLLPIEIPVTVENAIVGLVVTLGSLAFSELRNRRYAGEILNRTAAVSIAMAALVFAGCVTWDGAAFGTLARNEIQILAAQANSTRLDPARCQALEAGAAALRDETGDSRSLRLPFFSGQKLAGVGDSLERSAAICFELALMDSEGALDPMLRQRNRAAWSRDWSNGRALLGGGEGGN